MIYAPFYIDKGLVDGILNRPTGGGLKVGALPEGLPGGPPDWRIRFLPTLCPACGGDMQGARDAHVLICRNCQSLWRPGRKFFKRVGFARVASRKAATVYLPFWRIKAAVRGLDLETYADLVRAATIWSIPI